MSYQQSFSYSGIQFGVWRRPSDIVQESFQMSESLLSSLDSLSEKIFRSVHCTVMNSDAIVSLIGQTSVSVRLVHLILPLKYLFTTANQS